MSDPRSRIIPLSELSMDVRRAINRHPSVPRCRCAEPVPKYLPLFGTYECQRCHRRYAVQLTLFDQESAGGAA